MPTYILLHTHLSSLRSCTSSTIMWETECKRGSLSSLRSSIPVVQNNSRVDDDILLSKRICQCKKKKKIWNASDWSLSCNSSSSQPITFTQAANGFPPCKFRTTESKIAATNIPHISKCHRLKKTTVNILQLNEENKSVSRNKCRNRQKKWLKFCPFIFN